jgi:hypothetical protein
MTDSNKGKELLDERRNAENEALDKQSKPQGESQSQPIIIADCPSGVDGGVMHGACGGLGPVGGGGRAPVNSGGATGPAGQVVTPRTIPTPQPTSLPQTGGLPIIPGNGANSVDPQNTPIPLAEPALQNLKIPSEHTPSKSRNP